MTAPRTPALDRPIIFFGTEDFSAISLQALIDAGFPIAAVVTKGDTKKGRGQTFIEPKVKTIARQHGITVWQPQALSELIPLITPLQPVVGVLVSFGRIIPQTIIDLFEPGIINVHPSLLPQYRGPSPIETAILNNDASTGVSIMQLSARMDAGPVYTQRTLDLDEYRDQYGSAFSKASLYLSLGLMGAEQLIAALPEIVSGALRPKPQDEDIATYCKLISKHDGEIDWTKPAPRIADEIIAYAGWPGSRTTLDGIDVIITKGYSAPRPHHHSDNQGVVEPGTLYVNAGHARQSSEYPPLVIAAGKDTSGNATYLRITRLKPAGKKELSDREFVNGYGQPS